MSYIWKSLIIIIKKFSKILNPAYNGIILIKNIVHLFNILAEFIDLNLIFRWSNIKLIIPNGRSNLGSIKKVDSIFINCFDPPHDVYCNSLGLFSLIELKQCFMKCLLNVMSVSKILLHFCKSTNLRCSISRICTQTDSQQNN